MYEFVDLGEPFFDNNVRPHILSIFQKLKTTQNGNKQINNELELPNIYYCYYYYY